MRPMPPFARRSAARRLEGNDFSAGSSRPATMDRGDTTSRETDVKKRMTMNECVIAASLGLVLGASQLFAGAPNLVPEKPSAEPNYWCTWYAQNYWIKRGQDLKQLKGVTNEAAREELNEHAIFNDKDGWATTYLKRGRADYIFLIDHGWQTKDKSKRIAGGPAFFNLVAEESDFPRYALLEPRERLKEFNADIKRLGWNSLGIWVRGNIGLAEARTFAEWSKHAGIHYWKIDGGDTQEFNAFQAKQELYPELVLEYVTGAGGNLNPKWDMDLESYPSVYEIGGNLQQRMLECLQHSDTFRTYDASPLLMSATTLRRTHDILGQTQQQPEYRAVLNVQDDCNIAVGLGVLVASKRHPNMEERTLRGRDLHHQLSGPRCMQKRINEAERFGRWARIAPAFPAGEGTYFASDEELVDRCVFTEYDTWAENTYGKMVGQSAPAAMARNMPLPKVECDGPRPFVCVTTYPNGPTGIATEGRVSPENRWLEPRAKVTVQIKDASQPIGIVGRYRELLLEFAGSIEHVETVWAQDLLADLAVDITSKVVVSNNCLAIAGEVIDEVGTSAGDAGDISVPGMVLRLQGMDLPVAGDGFAPKARPGALEKPMVRKISEQADGYFGTAKLAENAYGYLVTASGPSQIVLKPLGKSIITGRFSIRWKMKPVRESTTKNGFIVLSSDEDANAALCAGAWIGANKISLFENKSKWGHDLSKTCKLEEELDCRLDVDLDLRTATLVVNGETLETAFSESVTSINYIGFGVHNSATLFTIPEIQ